MTGTACALCGITLPTGSLRYITEVSITADSDPVLVMPDDMDAEIQQALRAMEDAVGQGRARELDEQVVVRRAFLLCAKCRDAFLEGLPGRLQ